MNIIMELLIQEKGMEKMRNDVKRGIVRSAAAAIAAGLALTSGAYSAGAVSVETVKLKNNGEILQAPIAGGFTSSVRVTNDTDGEKSVQLITAVYDDLTGRLSGISTSEKTPLTAGDGATLEAPTNLETADGYTVKNYVWQSLGGTMTPYGAAQGGIIEASASTAVKGGVCVSWKEITEIKNASYKIRKNGAYTGAALAANAASYYDDEGTADDSYEVIAVDANGSIVASSASVIPELITVDVPSQPNIPDPEPVYSFDASQEITVTGSAESPAEWFSYSSADKQIGIMRDATTLDADTNKSSIGSDGCWTIHECAGRKALYTTNYQRPDKTQLQKGYIYADAGSSITKDDTALSLTVTYYDTNRSASFQLQYIDSSGAVKTIVMGQGASSGWITATYLISDAGFNAGFNTLGGADFRFYAAGYPINIAKISIAKTAAHYSDASFTAGDENIINGGGTESVKRSNDSSLQVVGFELTSDESGNLISAVNTDTGYLYVGDIDGKSAVGSGKLTRPDGNTRDGMIGVNLSPELFNQGDSEVVIEAVYNSKYAVPQLQYISGRTDSSFSVARASGVISDYDGDWKKVTHTLSNAHFNDIYKGKSSALIDGTAAFRYYTAGGARYYIHSVRVMTKPYYDNIAAPMYDYEKAYKAYLDSLTDKTPNAASLYPNGASVSFVNSAQVSDGLTIDDRYVTTDEAVDANILFTADGSAVQTTNYLGKNYTDSRKRLTYIYVNADKSYMNGIADNFAQFRLTYLDNFKNNITLQYVNTSGNVETLYYGGTASGKWKTVAFNVKNANLCASSLLNGFDFRIGVLTDEPSEENPNPVQIAIKEIRLCEESSWQQANDFSSEPRVYIAADSIAASYSDRSEIFNRYGWGEKLNLGVEIFNNAIPGASTKSFNSAFKAIAENIGKNDYVIMCFGHNDSMVNKPAAYTTVEEYKERLSAYIKQVQKRQAIPVILTSIPTLSSDGTVEYEGTAIQPYREAAMETGKQLGAVCFDIGAEFAAMLEKCGTAEEKAAYFVPDSETSTTFVHLSEQGASYIAELVEKALKNSDSVRVLKSYIPD